MKTAVPAPTAPQDAQVPYHNRELSWMDFNIRILDEAMRRENPLMERVKFLSITASNLDEFFMVRVAGLHEQVNSRYKEPDCSGLTPGQQLSLLSDKIHAFTERQYSCWNRSLLPALKKENIEFLSAKELTEEQLKEMLTFANGAASIVTTRKGALRVMPSKAEVEALISAR